MRIHRWGNRVTGITLAALLTLSVPSVALAAPVNPSDAEIAAAQQDKNDAAAQVGEISARMAAAAAEVDAAHAQANIALEDFLVTQAEFETAQAEAETARAAAKRADADLDESREHVAEYARSSYKDGSTSPEVRALLSAEGPAQMLERAALLTTVGEHRTDVLAAMATAQGAATVANRAADDALAQATLLKRAAEDALDHAEGLERAARSKRSQVAADQERLQADLEAAQEALLGVQGARAAAEEFQRKQEAEAAAAAKAAEKAVRDAKAAQAAQAKTASRADRPTAPTSRPSASAAPSGSAEPTPTASRPTPTPSAPKPTTPKPTTPAPKPTQPAPGGNPGGSSSDAQTAIDASLRWLGTSYAWGGGSLTGPSMGWGIDEGIVGFDCSGLTRYAYGKAGIYMPRTSREQYAAYPKVSLSNLQPGDLLFWANNVNNPSTIYHVAIYLGNGQMVEAPESGSTVRVSTARTSSRQYIGAVRPSA